MPLPLPLSLLSRSTWPWWLGMSDICYTIATVILLSATQTPRACCYHHHFLCCWALVACHCYRRLLPVTAFFSSQGYIVVVPCCTQHCTLQDITTTQTHTKCLDAHSSILPPSHNAMVLVVISCHTLQDITTTQTHTESSSASGNMLAHRLCKRNWK